jgi:hypothetical protein
MVTMSTERERYDPLPSLVELPSYLFRRLSPQGRRVAAAVGALLVVLAVVAATVVVPQLRSGAHDRSAQDDRRAASADAQLKARYEREARPIRGSGPAAAGRAGDGALAARRNLAAGLQAAVLADARERARRGELHGRYAAATCYGYPKQVDPVPPAEDVGRATEVVECLAVTSKVARDERTTSGSLIGQPYRALVDFAHGRFAFCKIVQQPGELSIQREPVMEVPRACGGKA